MKNLFAFALSAIIGLTAFAQEGHLKYAIDIKGDDPQVEMMKSFFAGATMEMYFADNFSRVDMNMGSMMTTKTIIDLKKEETLTLMSGMMGKIATTTQLEDINTEENPKLDIELIDESKEIIGLKCKKAIVTTEEGDELEMWYTNDIEVKDKRGLSMLNQNGIPGFPVEFSMQQGPMLMSFTLSEYNKKIKSKNVFDMTIPEGYIVKTAEELQEMGQ